MESEVIKEKAKEVVGQLELNSEWGDITYKITESFHQGKQIIYEVINLVAEIGQVYELESILFTDICCKIIKRDSMLRMVLLSQIKEITNTCNIENRSHNIQIELENGYINIEAVIKHTK